MFEQFLPVQKYMETKTGERPKGETPSNIDATKQTSNKTIATHDGPTGQPRRNYNRNRSRYQKPPNLDTNNALIPSKN